MKEKRQYILIIVLILAVLLIDQTIKHILIANENIQVSNNAIKVHYEKSKEQCLKNTEVVTKVLTDLLIIVILTRFLIRQMPNMNVATRISLAFILGGASSNLIDKIVQKKVINYINISSIISEFPSFNIANIFIGIGFVIFVIIVGIDLIKLKPRKEMANFEKRDTCK